MIPSDRAIHPDRLLYESFDQLSKIIKTVIPDKRNAIRIPGIIELVPRFRGDNAWIPSCAGMTKLVALCGCSNLSLQDTVEP
jgi:hypothetical protein